MLFLLDQGESLREISNNITQRNADVDENDFKSEKTEQSEAGSFVVKVRNR